MLQKYLPILSIILLIIWKCDGPKSYLVLISISSIINNDENFFHVYYLYNLLRMIYSYLLPVFSYVILLLLLLIYINAFNRNIIYICIIYRINKIYIPVSSPRFYLVVYFVCTLLSRSSRSFLDTQHPSSLLIIPFSYRELSLPKCV